MPMLCFMTRFSRHSTNGCYGRRFSRASRMALGGLALVLLVGLFRRRGDVGGLLGVCADPLRGALDLVEVELAEVEILVVVGSETPRSRLSGFLERLVPKRSLITAPAAARPRRAAGDQASSPSRRPRRSPERRPSSSQRRYRGPIPTILDWVFDRGFDRALVELDLFRSWRLACASGSRFIGAVARTRSLSRPLLLELEDLFDEPFRLVAFLRVVLVVCAICLLFAACCAWLGLCGRWTVPGFWSSPL